MRTLRSRCSRSIALFLISCLASVSAPHAAAPAPSPADRAAARAIDAYTGPLALSGDLSGQLLVTRGGAVVAERLFGKADAARRKPMTAETRLNIASLTKPMTGTIAIQLITEGKLRLADSIARWLPEFPKGDSITVNMLLRHRSGIPHQVIPDSEMTRPFTAAEVAARAARLPLDFSPGSRSSYSSGGFEVLARVLELASGKSYAELLDERICKPLGLAHTSHPARLDAIPDRADAFVPGVRGFEPAPRRDFSAIVGAGSVWSTARDLSRLVDGIVAGKLGAGPRFSYVHEGKLDFNGRTGGFKAWALYDTASAVGAYYIGNSSTGAPDALKHVILKLVAGEAAAPPARPALAKDAPPVSELEKWVGEFQIENGPHLSVHLEDGVLFSNDWIMLPAADGSMWSPRDYGIIRGVKGDDGRMARLDWVQDGQTYPAPRVSSAR